MFGHKDAGLRGTQTRDTVGTRIANISPEAHMRKEMYFALVFPLRLLK